MAFLIFCLRPDLPCGSLSNRETKFMKGDPTMKRALALILALVMTMALVACGGDKTTTSTPSTTTPGTSTPSTTEPSKPAEPEKPAEPKILHLASKTAAASALSLVSTLDRAWGWRPARTPERVHKAVTLTSRQEDSRHDIAAGTGPAHPGRGEAAEARDGEGEGGESRLFAGAPEPDGVCRAQSACAASLVYRVMLKNIPACSHKIVERLTVLARGQIVFNALTQNVVRTHEIICVASAVPENTMAVAYAGVEAANVVSQSIVERFYELIRLCGSYLVCAVIYHYLVVIVAVV